MYHGLLHLPHLTPIRDVIKGEAKRSKILAKRAVALKAVKLLHECGELNYYLMPKKIEEECDENEDDVDDCKSKAKTGTKKRKRYYAKETPSAFQGVYTRQPLYLHKINLVLVDELREEDNLKRNKVYHPELISRKLGFLASQALPAVCQRPFAAYLYSGKVMVSLECLGEVSDIEENEELFRHFHDIVLLDVLKVDSPLLQVCGQNNSDIILVPVREDGIDFEFLKSLQEAVAERDFSDAVVIPKHKNMERCFVQEILNDFTPDSMMPGETMSFRKYFTEKYNCNVTCNQRPLLRVSSADKKYDDMMNPIVIPQSSKRKPKTDEDFLKTRWILIPELVDIHKIPATLWQECQLLPFVIHQLERLMKVAKFRLDFFDWIGQTSQLENMDEARIPYPYDFNSYRCSRKFFRMFLKPPTDFDRPSSLMIDDLMRCFTATGAGLGYDLEREEILGDSFLKYVSTIQLFFKESKTLDEGKLTAKRSKIVGNKNLFKLAKEKNLHLSFQANKFVPRKNWKPPGYESVTWLENLLCQKDLERKEIDPKANLFDILKLEDLEEIDSEERLEEIIAQRTEDCNNDMNPEQRKMGQIEPFSNVLISDKSLADCVEALIGCALLDGGQAGAINLMSFMGLDVLPSESDSNGNGSKRPRRVVRWFEKPSSAFHDHLSQLLIERSFELHLKKIDIGKIEGKLKYRFQDKSFLLQALTHCSYIQNKITNSLERLEFLGDAVIDYLVTCHIFLMYPNCTPGEVTDLRSAVVNNNTFAKIIVDNDLHPCLLQNSEKLWSKIDKYIASEKSDSDKNDYMANLELHNEDHCPVYEYIEVPKVLGDILESLMGAIYLDSGFNLECVWQAFQNLFPDMDMFLKQKPVGPVKTLYEQFPDNKISFIKEERKNNRSVMYVEIKMPGKSRPFRCGGIGNNTKSAKYAACTCAIRELKKRDLWKTA